MMGSLTFSPSRSVMEIGDVALPERMKLAGTEVMFEGDDSPFPYDFEMEVRLEANRPPGCESLVLRRRRGGPPITADGLRQLPIALLIELAMAPVSNAVGYDEGLIRRPGPEVGSDIYATFRAENPRRRKVTPELLREVSQVYSLALAVAHKPLEAISDVFKTSPSTAARWVRAAREAGLLEAPTMHERAAEHR